MTRAELAAKGLAEITKLFAQELGLIPAPCLKRATWVWEVNRVAQENRRIRDAHDLMLVEKYGMNSETDTVVVKVSDILRAMEGGGDV